MVPGVVYTPGRHIPGLYLLFYGRMGGINPGINLCSLGEWEALTRVYTSVLWENGRLFAQSSHCSLEEWEALCAEFSLILPGLYLRV